MNPTLVMLGLVYWRNSWHNTWSPPSIQNLKNFHVKACYDINTRYFAKSWVLCDNLSIPYNCDFVEKASQSAFILSKVLCSIDHPKHSWPFPPFNSPLSWPLRNRWVISASPGEQSRTASSRLLFCSDLPPPSPRSRPTGWWRGAGGPSTTSSEWISPLWHFDREEDAKKSLLRLRGVEYDVEKELREIVEKKMRKEQAGNRSVIKSILSKEFLLPFVKIGILMSLSQWAGINILSSYLVTVFEVRSSWSYILISYWATKGERLKLGSLVGPDHGLRHPAGAQHPLLFRPQVQHHILQISVVHLRLSLNTSSMRIPHCLFQVLSSKAALPRLRFRNLSWRGCSCHPPLSHQVCPCLCLCLATHHYLTRF